MRQDTVFNDLRWSRRVLCLAALIAGQWALPAAAVNYAFTTLNVPGSIDTNPQSINAKGQVTGTYYTDPNNGRSLSFIYSGGTYTVLDAPGSDWTSAGSINARGQVVGVYDVNGASYGFLYSGGVFMGLRPPGSTWTSAYGINDRGQAVGNYGSSNGIHGFIFSGGAYTTLDVPGQGFFLNTDPFNINNSGQVIGNYYSSGLYHGFLYGGGEYTTLDPPGSKETVPTSINAQGQVVGYYYYADGATHGFLYSGGAFTVLDMPGSTSTSAISINAKGQIVGVYVVNDFTTHGFLYSGGGFTTLDVPGSKTTSLASINENGQVAGWYADANGGHGFIATPLAAQTVCWFNWEESQRPDLYAPAGAPTLAANYAYRAYPASRTFLGVFPADNHVFHNDEILYQEPDGKLLDEGPLSAWMPNANCQTSANMNECMFNWAENTYPADFSPAGASTRAGTYTYRFYTATNTYLGVASHNNHAYAKTLGGPFQDLGLLSDLVAQADCQ